MKKLVYIPAAAGVLAFGGIVLANTDTTEPTADTVNSGSQNIESTNKDQKKGSMLTFEEVSAKALKIADGNITDIELDNDDRRAHYEVDVDFEDYEYDLKFDAFSGELLEQDREKDDDRDDKREHEAKAAPSEKASEQERISSDEAVKAALNAAKGGTLEEAELDYDDGVLHYDIEIRNGDFEHEVAVNAHDGSIIEHEKDQDDDDDHDDD